MSQASSRSARIELVERRPRLLAPPPVETQFDIPAPPAIEKPQPPQTAMILVPALTTVSILVFGVVSKQKYLIFIGILVTIGAMATPLLMYLGNKRAAKRRNEQRQRRYGEIIDEIASRAQAASEAMRLTIETAHPAPDEYLAWIKQGRLWERRRTDQDFLDVAVGVANIPSGLVATLARNSALDADVPADLLERAEKVASAARVLENAPYCLTLLEQSVLCIAGPRPQALALARAMLLEAVACCGADELSLLIATPSSRRSDWRWAAAVPHGLHKTEPSQATSSIVTSGEDFASVLARTVGPRKQLLADTTLSVAGAGIAHLIIVLDEYHPMSELQETPLLHETMSQAGQLGVTVVTIPDVSELSPPESTAILTVDAAGLGYAQLVRSPSPPVRFMALTLPAEAAEKVADIMSTRKLLTEYAFGGSSAGDLLLDLIGRRPLPATPSWPDLEPSEFLTATFGLQSDGRPFTLDLKEGAVGGHGPHGLLVGATGSGKSELLRSMVISLALTHSPDWLQMAFVDFKGGAAFDALAELPHCVGQITNILDDLSLIERMRSSLTGELLARQRQLAAAGPDLQGIRDYWKLRKDQPELPPMPYLLVVIDEFAELLEVDPAFLELLLAVGRQGRSLGVHLILSSQRLEAGRIRGLESYLSYRIAMRTFNAEESSTAIGSKLAAELPPLAGHGYYKATDTFLRFKASQVSVDGGGPAYAPDTGDHDGVTDLLRAVRCLSSVPKAPELWLPPLPNSAQGDFLAMDDERLRMRGVSVEAGLPVAVGLRDDPPRRLQEPAAVDPAHLGGHVAIVGAPQSGKSSAIATLVLQAARTYPASLLRFFILDFGGRMLHAVRDLPNVGAYATSTEPNRIARVLNEMLTLLDERPIESRRDGISSMSQQRARAARSAGAVQAAHTVLIIDNYAAFKERYPDQEPVVERVLVEGANFGLHLHVTSARWGDLSARKLDQIATRFELRLNDPTESQFGRLRAVAIQTSGPGRGLTSPGRQVQMAAPILSARGSAPARLDDVALAVTTHARQQWGNAATSPLLLLDDLTAAGFRDAAPVTPSRHAFLGVGESGFRPVLFELGVDGNLMLFGDPDSGRTATLARIVSGSSAAGALDAEADVYIVDCRGDLVDALASDVKVCNVATTEADIHRVVAELKSRLQARMGTSDQADRDAGRPIVLVIDDYDLVQAMSPVKAGSLHEISHFLLLSRRLRFSAMVNQLAANFSHRMADLVTKRALESGAWRMHFSATSRGDFLSLNYRGRRLPPGVAELIRPGQPDSLVRTLSPANRDDKR